jgi:hypothetical protein
MRRLQSFLLSSAILIAPAAAFAQSEAGSQSPGTSAQSTTHQAATPGAVGASPTDIIPPTKNAQGMVRTGSPDSPAAQLQNPTGAEPGTGSGMGKVSGTAAGN